jgi:hypothetical protein
METRKDLVDVLRKGTEPASDYTFLINLAKWFKLRLPNPAVIFRLNDIAKKFKVSHKSKRPI